MLLAEQKKIYYSTFQRNFRLMSIVFTALLFFGNTAFTQNKLLINVKSKPYYLSNNTSISRLSSNFNYDLTLKNPPRLASSVSDKNLQNIPFRFGLELASVLSFDNNIEFDPVVLGFIDVHLTKNKYYLKLEYGRVFETSRDKNTNLATLGLNVKITEKRSSNLFIHGAVMAVWGKTEGGPGGGLSGLLSIRYLYSFSKYLGLVSSIRYPFGAFDTFMFSTGIQFLTY